MKVKNENGSFVLPVLFVLLFLIAGLLVYMLFGRTVPPPVPAPGEQYLAAAAPAPGGFRIQDVPSWLFVRLAVIAVLQVMALIAAYRIAAEDTRNPLSRTRLSTVQFLCEVPMYLGLFGTLLGVCLTQFVTGSLVAPLAYLTTMSGILLHVFGKLAIWLPHTSGQEFES